MKKLISIVMSFVLTVSLISVSVNTVFAHEKYNNDGELIYQSDGTEVYSTKLSDGIEVISQYDNNHLTSKVFIDGKDSTTLYVEYYDPESGTTTKAENINCSDVLTRVEIETDDTLLYATNSYSKLGDIKYMKTVDGSYFTIGYFYETTSIGNNVAYTPNAGSSFTLSVVISTLVGCFSMPAAIASSLINTLLVNAGVALVTNGIVYWLSGSAIVCRPFNYAVRLNYYNESMIVNRTTTSYVATAEGMTKTFYSNIGPIKNSTTGMGVRDIFFPSGGATYIGWL